MEATANTGQNDTSSGSIYNLFDKVAGVANAGLSIYNAVNNPKTPNQTLVAEKTTPQPVIGGSKTWKDYLPWIAGGVVGLILLVFLLRK